MKPNAQRAPYFWENDVIRFTTERNTFQTIIYGTQNGLASSEISCLAQDSKGFIWVGTSAGLSRYDGIKFENYLKAENHFTGKIYAVKEDAIRNILWVACDAGLCYFSDNQLHLAHFKEQDVTVYDVYFSDDKNLWLATGKGPVKFPQEIVPLLISQKEISLAACLLPEWKFSSTPNSIAYKITDCKNGNIYIGGFGAVFLFNRHHLKQIWSSTHNQNNNDNVVGMVRGKEDTILFATPYSGLCCVKNEKVMKVSDDGGVGADLLIHQGHIFYFSTDGIFQYFSPTRDLEKISEVPESIEYMDFLFACR